MRSILLIVVFLAVTGAVVGGAFWYTHHNGNPTELILYGNVDLRQVSLAFNNNERIAEVLVEEGDTVQEGMVLARLDKSRLEPQVANMKALADAQWQAYLKLKNGSRPEEIVQAEANLRSAQADAVKARDKYERYKRGDIVQLSDKSVVRSVSQEDFDSAKAAWEVSEEKVINQQKALELARAGPRKEEKAEAEARYAASKSQFDFLSQQLKDADLRAPADAVVRTRLMEPGEMSSPQKPVFSLAIIKTKWVRAYVAEPDLGKVKDRMPASIAVDSFPDRRFTGWVGFVSPVSEFTPKAVQTEELRTSLVYEVRVFLHDPNNELRLGMPATVYLSLE